jgi:FMN-dependent NADH-azoreductase
MSALLQLNTSMFSADGQSSLLADSFVAAWQASHPGARVMARDLARDPVPHLSAERFQSFIAEPETRSAEQQAVVDFSDALIAELRNAEVIVLGLPMYNFGVPSTLKSYFDHIARAGVTFRYSEQGPIGLLTGKKAYVFATRGGLYAGTAQDTQTAYVRNFLRFIGIEDVEFIYAEGLNLGDSSKSNALAQAQVELAELAA